MSGTRPTQAAADKGAPKQKLEFAYDWLGRRIGKRVSSTTSATIASATWTPVSDERFVYNGWNPIAVFDASGTTLTSRQTYLWGLDLSGSLQGAGGVGGLLAVNTVSPQSVCYPAYDGNGNIIAWTASNGDTLQRIDYDPFGNRVTREGNTAFDAPAFGFSTKYQDKETGLLYYGYRYYDPVTGRWPSRDPIEEEGGVNLYGFVSNNGVNQLDYLGMVSPKCLEASKAAIEQGVKLLQALSEYDRARDAIGGERQRVGLTKPGGHYRKIIELQNGVRRKLAHAYRMCKDDDDDGNGLSRKKITMPYMELYELGNRAIPVPPGIAPLPGGGGPPPWVGGFNSDGVLLGALGMASLKLIKVAKECTILVWEMAYAN